MRRIESTNQFKRDYKRVKSSPKHQNIQALLENVVGLLVKDEILPVRFHDHSMIGNWQDCRDCHIKPDLVLIYRKVDEDGDDDGDVLQLIRLGSHSELGI